jgi:hypothetical protein
LCRKGKDGQVFEGHKFFFFALKFKKLIKVCIFCPLKRLHMIKFNNIKLGDYLIAEFEGTRWTGEVVRLNGDEKQVCLQTEVQDFWFNTDKLHPIPLNEEQLLQLNFTKQPNEDGSIKYLKGAFRIVTPRADNFSEMEIWYREDRRHNPAIEYVHELQNAYLDMTKVHLTKEPM